MILNCLNYWWYLSVSVIFLFVMCFAATHAVGEAYVMESRILPGWRNLLRGFSTISGMLLRSSTRLKYVSQFSNATTEGQKMLYFSWPFCYNISRMQYCYEHWPATNRQSSLRMLLASLIHTAPHLSPWHRHRWSWWYFGLFSANACNKRVGFLVFFSYQLTTYVYWVKSLGDGAM